MISSYFSSSLNLHLDHIEQILIFPESGAVLGTETELRNVVFDLRGKYLHGMQRA